MLAPVGAVTAIVPVGVVHVGCAVTLAVGLTGGLGTLFIETGDEAAEMQPVSASVTLKLKVPPADRPEMVVVAPDPAIAPGLMIQLPDGNPEIETLPVVRMQVGCIIEPITGAFGTVGSIKTIGPASELAELHPEEVAEMFV